MKREYGLFLLISLFLFTACTITPKPPSKSEVSKLSREIVSLSPKNPSQKNPSPKISQSKATIISDDIYKEVNHLTEKFSLISPPWFHNFLVNVGLREKGLCYHWADALYIHLMQKGYSEVEFHLVGANIGEYFFEHNAIVIVGKGKNVSEGIVLDPWRNSGKLFHGTVKKDKKYQWKHRPDRGCERKFIRYMVGSSPAPTS